MSMTEQERTDPSGRGILVLRLLGGFSARINGAELKIPSRKAQAVLAMLAVDPDGLQTREFLRGTLWSESTEQNAQYSLRNILWSLRSAFEACSYAAFETMRTEIRLNPEAVATDVGDIVLSLGSAEPHPKLCESPDILGTFMHGFEGLDQAYDDWLRQTRTALQRGAIARLESQLARPQQDPASLVPVARLLVDYDGLNEAACQALIRGYRSQGATANALSVYQELWNSLDAAYGEEPSQATQDLIVELKSDMAALSAPDGSAKPVQMARSADPRPRLFIGEADTASLERKWHHLLRGFRHDLMTSLIRFREWQIVDLAGLSDEKAEALITPMSFQLSVVGFENEGEISISMTFKDVGSGVFVWSERFERRIDSWFGLQKEIVQRIAVALNLHLSTDRLERLSGQEEESLAAYDQWLLGSQLSVRAHAGKLATRGGPVRRIDRCASAICTRLQQPRRD